MAQYITNFNFDDRYIWVQIDSSLDLFFDTKDTELVELI